ncbi:hypothetical protein SEA_SIXAMA_13 [Gordonia phage Sixama]|uniref:Uncharacterized protein n=1 Tax=Gordonia phage Sixama TaxID=2653271 RepID=A0A5Q2F0B3_9CAUD|nr:hypothetical protein PP302_gp013 [Gordonia phage Sixama]QGF20192.1 hypothetical protein SEA_SIXAMA_13 [Gordonia phage Sixama]
MSNTTDVEILEWMHARLVDHHGERPLYDYMWRYREVIEKIKKFGDNGNIVALSSYDEYIRNEMALRDHIDDHRYYTENDESQYTCICGIPCGTRNAWNMHFVEVVLSAMDGTYKDTVFTTPTVVLAPKDITDSDYVTVSKKKNEKPKLIPSKPTPKGLVIEPNTRPKKHVCSLPWQGGGYGSTGHPIGTIFICEDCNQAWETVPCYESLGPVTHWSKVRWYHRDAKRRIQDVQKWKEV